MLRNGLYSLAAVSLDGVDAEVGGVLILRDGHITGGDSFVFYTGTYEFSGTYNDAGAEADATVTVAKHRIRYDAMLRFLAAVR